MRVLKSGHFCHEPRIPLRSWDRMELVGTKSGHQNSLETADRSRLPSAIFTHLTHRQWRRFTVNRAAYNCFGLLWFSSTGACVELLAEASWSSNARMSRKENNGKGLERERVRERRRERLEEREKVSEERLKTAEGLTGAPHWSLQSNTPKNGVARVTRRGEDNSPLFPQLVGPLWTNWLSFIYLFFFRRG